MKNPAVYLNLLGAVLCVLSLLIAYFYMERYLLLEACPLCILDRFVVAIMAAGFATNAWASRTSGTSGASGAGGGRRVMQKVSWWVVSVALLAGFVLTGRHIWLQAQPFNESGGCLLDSESVQNVLVLIGRAFDANADCGGIAWEFLGLSIPQQLLVFFIFIAILQGVIFNLRKSAGGMA